jgi:hypothetical protein
MSRRAQKIHSLIDTDKMYVLHKSVNSVNDLVQAETELRVRGKAQVEMRSQLLVAPNERKGI